MGSKGSVQLPGALTVREAAASDVDVTELEPSVRLALGDRHITAKRIHVPHFVHLLSHNDVESSA
eukprot:2820221-Amphidinium_carterae.1